MSGTNPGVDPAWLKRNLTSSEDVIAFYDDWAASYNETLQAWQYQCPAVAAGLMG